MHLPFNHSVQRMRAGRLGHLRLATQGRMALPAEGVCHNLVSVSIQKTCPMQQTPLARTFHEAIGLDGSGLINTPLQRGDRRGRCIRNRFNGFVGVGGTVSTVSSGWEEPLKRFRAPDTMVHPAEAGC
jgi:hypothetical protein